MCENNWISVEDKLPDEKQELVMYSKEIGKTIHAFYNDLAWRTFEPTHWMPYKLPKPPKNK